MGDANDPLAALAMDDDRSTQLAKETRRRRRDERVGAKKSAALLAARCAMAALFFFVGSAQIKRIVARGLALFSSPIVPETRPPEGIATATTTTGSCWSLRSRRRSRSGGGHAVTRALTLTLFAEAFGCWGSGRRGRFRPDHARAHFVTNLACGGGLMLLQASARGRYRGQLRAQTQEEDVMDEGTVGEVRLGSSLHAPGRHGEAAAEGAIRCVVIFNHRTRGMRRKRVRSLYGRTYVPGRGSSIIAVAS